MNCKVLFLLMCFSISLNDSNGARTFKLMKDVIGSNTKPAKSEFGTRIFSHKKMKSFKKANSYTIPSRYRWIDENTFEDHKGLFSINIPNGMSVVDDYAFFNCHRVKSLTFSKQLEYIGKFAFADCCTLACIDMPGSLLPENVNITMFDECCMLKNVNIYLVNGVVSERLKEAIILAVAYKYTHPIRHDLSDAARVNEAARLADAYRIVHMSECDEETEEFLAASSLLKEYKWSTNINIINEKK